jgi:hypothetical protein
VAPVRKIDERLAWLWARHPDTISGWHISESAIPSSIRAMFPINWSLLDGPWIKATAGPAGRCFR